jgi:hypothetical protein
MHARPHRHFAGLALAAIFVAASCSAHACVHSLCGGSVGHDGKWSQMTLHRTSDRNIPEPGFLALLGIGLMAAALSSRGRRSQS